MTAENTVSKPAVSPEPAETKVTFKPGAGASSTARKSNLVRRLSKRIRRIVDEKVVDDRNSDQSLLENITDTASPGKPVKKSTSLNRDKPFQVSVRRRLGSKHNTIAKCHFDLRDFEEYNAGDIPALAEHFKQCTDPAHILPIKKQESRVAFSSKPPFVKVKKEDIPDVAYAEENHQEDPEIQKIIDILVKRAEEYNSHGLQSQDPEMRNLVLASNSNLRWYIVHRCWDYVKATSRNINWVELLKMFM